MCNITGWVVNVMKELVSFFISEVTIGDCYYYNMYIHTYRL